MNRTYNYYSPNPPLGKNVYNICFAVFVIQIESDIIAPKTNNRKETIWSLKMVNNRHTLPPPNVGILFLCRDQIFPKRRSYKGSSSSLKSSDPLLVSFLTGITLMNSLQKASEVIQSSHQPSHLDSTTAVLFPLSGNLTWQATILPRSGIHSLPVLPFKSFSAQPFCFKGSLPRPGKMVGTSNSSLLFLGHGTSIFQGILV